MQTKTPSLALKPDLADAEKHWLAFWDREMLDRPCCMIRAAKDGAKPVPGPRYMAGAREDLQTVADQALANAATVWWGGDAVPYYTPSFGPDMMAAWLGADLEFDANEYGTNWVRACVESADAWPDLRLDPDNRWWRRMLDFCAVLARTFEGQMIVAHLDLHSNMDTLSAMRTPAGVCMDMLDAPDTIDRVMRTVRALYRPIYDGLYQAGQMQRTGTCGWVPAYHPVRTNTIQCDFAALIGPEHFRHFVLPALEEEADHLGHCVYHLDGPECLVHLDDLCSIRHLDCIQWTTGARNPDFPQWLDLLKAIQAKGKSLWIPCSTESIKLFHRELKHNQLFYDCWAPTQKAGEETLKWLRANS